MAAFLFWDVGLAKMLGEGWLETFVSGELFWFYFASREVMKRDMTPARSLDIRAGVLIPVSLPIS